MHHHALADRLGGVRAADQVVRGATDLEFEQTLFKVRVADKAVGSSTASRIIKKMYAWRGYKVAWLAKRQPHSISLVGAHGAAAVATTYSSQSVYRHSLSKADEDEIFKRLKVLL